MLTKVVNEIAAAYEATGAAWRHGPGPIYGRLADVLWDGLTFDLRGWQVLDLGSGTGAASDAARRRGAEVVALDIAAGMLRGRTDLTVPAVVGDAVCLPFRADSFDAALAAFSLNHLVDPAAALREVDRVVRPGGAVVVGAYAEGDGHPVRAAVRAAAAAAGWTPPVWEAVLRASAIPQLATPNRAVRAATSAGIPSAVATCVEVPFPDVSAADLERGDWAWRRWRRLWRPSPRPNTSSSLPTPAVGSARHGHPSSGRSSCSPGTWTMPRDLAARRE